MTSRRDESELLNWLREWFRQQKHSPTIREIADGTGIKGGTLQRRLMKLKEKRYIDWDPGRNRTIRLLQPEKWQPNPTENLILDDPGIPILGAPKILMQGEIVAGKLRQPLGDGEVLDLSYLSNQSDNSPDYFAIRVVGDSMIGDNIVEGDIAIMRRVEWRDAIHGIQQGLIGKGEIVAARVEDEGTTLKRCYREEKKKKIRLEASNPDYEPKSILIAEDRVQIQGVLVGIWREAPRPSRRGIR